MKKLAGVLLLCLAASMGWAQNQGYSRRSMDPHDGEESFDYQAPVHGPDRGYGSSLSGMGSRAPHEDGDYLPARSTGWENASKQDLEQAYNLFELDKKVHPDDITIYEQQNQILHYKLFGNRVPRIETDDEIVQIYKSNVTDAKRRLDIIHKIFELKKVDMTEPAPAQLQDLAQEAFLICLALGQPQAAAEWMGRIGGPCAVRNDTTSRTLQRVRDAHWQAVRKQYRDELKRAVSQWHRSHHPADK